MQVLTQNYYTCITFFQKSFMSVQIKVYMYVMENGLNWVIVHLFVKVSVGA